MVGHQKSREVPLAPKIRTEEGGFVASRVVGRRASHRGGRVEYQVVWERAHPAKPPRKKGHGNRKDVKREKACRAGAGAFVTWEPRENLLGQNATSGEDDVSSTDGYVPSADKNNNSTNKARDGSRSMRSELFAVDLGHRLRLNAEIADMYGLSDEALASESPSHTLTKNGKRARASNEVSVKTEGAQELESSASDCVKPAEISRTRPSHFVGSPYDHESRCMTKVTSIAGVKQALLGGKSRGAPVATSVRPIYGADSRLILPVIAIPNQRGCSHQLDADTAPLMSASPSLHIPLGDSGSFPHINRFGEHEPTTDNEWLLGIEGAVRSKRGVKSPASPSLLATAVGFGDLFHGGGAPVPLPAEVVEHRGQKVSDMFESIDVGVRRKMSAVARTLSSSTQSAKKGGDCLDKQNELGVLPSCDSGQITSLDYFATRAVLMQQVFGSGDDLRAAMYHTPNSQITHLADVGTAQSNPQLPVPPPSWAVWAASKWDALRGASFVSRVPRADLDYMYSSTCASEGGGAIMPCAFDDDFGIEIYGIKRNIHFDDTSSSSSSGDDDDANCSQNNSARIDPLVHRRDRGCEKFESCEFDVADAQDLLAESESDDDKGSQLSFATVDFDLSAGGDQVEKEKSQAQESSRPEKVGRKRARNHSPLDYRKRLSPWWQGESDFRPERTSEGNTVLFFVRKIGQRSCGRQGGEALGLSGGELVATQSAASALVRLTTTSFDGANMTKPMEAGPTDVGSHSFDFPEGEHQSSCVSSKLLSMPLSVFRHLFPQQLIDFLLKNSLVLS